MRPKRKDEKKSKSPKQKIVDQVQTWLSSELNEELNEDEILYNLSKTISDIRRSMRTKSKIEERPGQ